MSGERREERLARERANAWSAMSELRLGDSKKMKNGGGEKVEKKGQKSYLTDLLYICYNYICEIFNHQYGLRDGAMTSSSN